MKRAAIFALAVVALANRADAAEPAVKLDELAAADPEVRGHADEWAYALKLDPTQSGYVIADEAPTGRPGAAGKAAHDAVVYLVTGQGIDPARLHEAKGARRPVATIEFWMVPEGGSPPVPK